MISKKDIIGQKIKKCFETKGIHSKEHDMTSSTLTIELENGLLFNLTDSFDDVTHNLKINNKQIKKDLKRSTPCFNEIWGDEILAIVTSDYIYIAGVLLRGNILVQFGNVTPWSVSPFYEKYKVETDEQLLDFWDNTAVELLQVG